MAEAFIYDNTEQQNKYQAEGIEILVQMAKAGKIDPWNIDIIDVTDKYLSHLFVKIQQTHVILHYFMELNHVPLIFLVFLKILK